MKQIEQTPQNKAMNSFLIEVKLSINHSLFEKGYNGKYEHVAVDDAFVPHATVKSLLKKFNLDTVSIVEKFSEK